MSKGCVLGVRLGVLWMAVCLLAAPSRAEVIGLGAQGAWVRPRGADGNTFYGGVHFRFRPVPWVGVEGAWSIRNDSFRDGGVNLRSRPWSGSLMLYLSSSWALSPYLIGGFDYYVTTLEFLDGATEQQKKFGYHVGIGGHGQVSRHVAVFGEVRYEFVRIPVLREARDQEIRGFTTRLGVTLFVF